MTFILRYEDMRSSPSLTLARCYASAFSPHIWSEQPRAPALILNYCLRKSPPARCSACYLACSKNITELRLHRFSRYFDSSSGMRNCWTSSSNFLEGVPTCSPPALSEARLCLRLVLAATFGVLLRQARSRTTGLIGLQEVSERNCLRLFAMQAIFGAFARSATDQAMQKLCPTTCPVVCPVLLARCGIVAVRPVNSVGSSLGGWSSFGLSPSPHKRLNIRPDPTAPQGLSDY